MAVPQRRLADHVLGARILAGVAVLSGVAAGLTALLAGHVLLPGRGTTFLYTLAAATLVLGVVLALARRGITYITAVAVLSGDGVWAAICWMFVDPAVQTSPAYLYILAAMAGVFLDRRAVLVKMVLVVPALFIGLSATMSGAVLWQAIVVQAIQLDLFTLVVHRMSRHIDRTVAHVWALSNEDPLTGVPNRRFVDNELPRLVADAEQAGQMVCAVLVDLDHFKKINDDHGHALGDEVLVSVATDLAELDEGPARLLARIGGEEFLLLAVVATADQGRDLAERVHRVIGAMRAPVPVTGSVGLSVARPGPGTDPLRWGWALVDRADEAMYRAKQAGRDRVVAADAVPLCVAQEDRSTPGSPGRPQGSGRRGTSRRCPTRRHRDADRAKQVVHLRTVRWLGAAAAGGAVIILANQLMTGRVSSGAGQRLYLACAAFLALLALVLLRSPRLGARVFPVLPLSGVALWTVIQSVQADPDAVHLAGSTLLPGPLFAAWFTGLRPLVLALASVPVGLYIVLVASPLGASPWLIVTDAVVVSMVSLFVYWLRRRSEALLEVARGLSTVDMLTGLANRRHLEEHAPTLADLCRSQSRRLALLQVDLDHFKRINDTLGHAAGDDVLRALGGALPSALGEDDVAGRTGGEEVVLLALVDDEVAAMALAERVRALVTEVCSTPQVRVTCSIGVVAAEAPPANVDPVGWLWGLSARADTALYAAKSRGRDRCVAAEPDAGTPVPVQRAVPALSGSVSGSGPPAGRRQEAPPPRP